MKHSAFYVTTLVMSLFLSTNASAEENSAELSPVTITANRINQTDIKAPYASEVHQALDIEKSGATSLYDYLSRFSSVTVLPSFGNPYSQLIDMRGYGIGDGYQNIVVTVNGRRLNNVDMSPQLLSSIPVDSIERIEIIKGSGSVAQGDGAMAGTINIITKDQNGGSVNVSGGSHGHSSTSASLGISEASFALQILAESSRNDGFRDTDINDKKDTSNTNNLSAALKIFPVKDAEIRIGTERSWLNTTYGDVISNLQFGNNPKQNNGKQYNQQEFNTDTNRVGATYKLGQGIIFNVDHFNEKKTSAYIAPFPFASDYNYRSTDLSTQLQIERLQLVVGTQLFDGERDGGTNTTNKNNLGYYLQANYNLDNTVLSTGVRREEVKYEYAAGTDHLKDQHNLTAWELGVNHQYTHELSIFANYNQGFQAPDIDRFFATDYSNYPVVSTVFNSFINPAESKTFNLGLNHLTAKNKLKATLYYSKLTNEIYFYSVPFPGTSLNTNIDKSHKYGLELQDHYQIAESMAARINYTWTQAKIDKEDSGNGAFNGNNMPGVSKHAASFGIDYQPVQNGTLSLNQTWRSRAYALNDFGNNFSQKQKAFNTTDLGYSHKFERISAYVQVNNLFDQANGLWVADDAIYPVNFVRTWYAGIRASF